MADAHAIDGSRSQEDTIVLLAAAVRHSRTPCCITDADLDAPGPTILYANPAYCEMVGRSEAEVLGRSPRTMQGPLTERAELDRLRATLANGEPFRGETVNYRKDGTPFIISWDVIPVHDSTGELRWFVASQQDFTALRQAETLIAAERELAERTEEITLDEPLLAEASAAWCDAVRRAASRFTKGGEVAVVLHYDGASGDRTVTAGSLDDVGADRLAPLLVAGASEVFHTRSGAALVVGMTSVAGTTGLIVLHGLSADVLALVDREYVEHFARFAGAQFDRVLTATFGPARDTADTTDPVATAFRAYRAHPTVLLRNVLLEAHLPLAVRVAARFADVDDAEGVATMELLRCVDRFDPARGVPFAAFATTAMRAELRHAREAQRWAVDVPRAVRRNVSKVNRAAAELTVLLGAHPTLDEIAAHANLTRADVDAARLAEATGLSPTRPAGSPDADALAAPVGDADAVASEALLRVALDRLNERDRQLLTLRLDAGLSQREIAELLGTNQMRVSRSLARLALALLAELAEPPTSPHAAPKELP